MKSFAFIMHPLQISDFTRKFKLAEKVPERWLEGIARRLPPFTVSEVTGLRSPLGNEVKGWFVGCPLTARQMVELPEDVVLEKIIKAAQKAESLGADIIGLGAFTAIVGDAGITVSKSVNVPVTTGNSYTVATALSGIEMAARMLNVDLARQNIVVLGASGSIGKACARIMARRGFDVTLVARRKGPLEDVATLIQAESQRLPRIETNMAKALKDADVIIAVTSALEDVIDETLLKPGTIISDVARPRNVSKRVAEKRKDVFVFEGGVVSPPGEVEFNFNFGFPPRTCYACMAETMLLALEGKFESFSLGRELDVKKIEEIDRLAERHGFQMTGLRSFERAVTDDDVRRVRSHLAELNGSIERANLHNRA